MGDSAVDQLVEAHQLLDDAGVPARTDDGPLDLGVRISLVVGQVRSLAEVGLALVDVAGRLNSFCAELESKGLHVGVNGFCASCKQQWPCNTAATMAERL